MAYTDDIWRYTPPTRITFDIWEPDPEYEQVLSRELVENVGRDQFEPMVFTHKKTVRRRDRRRRFEFWEKKTTILPREVLPGVWEQAYDPGYSMSRWEYEYGEPYEIQVADVG